MCDSTIKARMPGIIYREVLLPHHSTAARNLRRDDGRHLATYYDEAFIVDLCITEEGNRTPLTSFQHVTTAIVLVPYHEEFDTLRADIAAIYHAKVGHGNGTGQNEGLRPDQLPTLIIQHGISSGREWQYLDSVGVKPVLNHARVKAKYNGEMDMIVAVMPRGTV